MVVSQPIAPSATSTAASVAVNAFVHEPRCMRSSMVIAASAPRARTPSAPICRSPSVPTSAQTRPGSSWRARHSRAIRAAGVADTDDAGAVV